MSRAMQISRVRPRLDCPAARVGNCAPVHRAPGMRAVCQPAGSRAASTAATAWAGRQLVCEGCGQPALMPMAGPACFVCENRAAMPDVVHTLRPPPGTSPSVFPCSEVKTGSKNPFIKYRALSWVYAQCREQGFSDADYCPGPPGTVKRPSRSPQ